MFLLRMATATFMRKAAMTTAWRSMKEALPEQREVMNSAFFEMLRIQTATAT
jgi:hypothetical protein